MRKKTKTKGKGRKKGKVALPHKLKLDAEKRGEVLKHIHVLEQEDPELWSKNKLEQTNKGFMDYATKLKKLLKRSRKL